MFFHNTQPGRLADELTQAKIAGVSPVRGALGMDTLLFDEALNRGNGVVKWAVEGDELRIVPAQVEIPGVTNLQEIAHSVLTEGRPVRAAGTARIMGAKGTYWGLYIDNWTGHFQTSEASVQI